MCRTTLSASDPFRGMLAVLVAGVIFGTTSTRAQSPALEMWVYAPVNLLVDAEVDRLESLLERSAAAGYTHCLIADSKFSRLGEMDKRYFDHVRRIRQTAEKLKIELVPALFPVGYSNDILSQDPNLVEGLPVRDTRMMIGQDGVARHAPEDPLPIPSPSDRSAWGFIDDPFVSQEDSLVASNVDGRTCRAMKPLELIPFRQYHVRYELKTNEYAGSVEIKLLDTGGKSYLYTLRSNQPTQDWTEYHLTFNSLDNQSLNFYVGVWGARPGTFAVRNIQISESGPVNVIRRPGTPLVLRTETTPSRTLIEGQDFESVSDPRLGTVPYAGEYEPWHEPITIRMKGKWQAGTALRLSYYHPHIIYENQLCGCVTEPKFMELLDQQAIDVLKLFDPVTVMLSHDEWRVMGWDESFAKTKKTPGEVMAENLRQCVKIVDKHRPGTRQVVWSDMFDPHHNAVAQYYLVNGDVRPAAEAIESPTIVMNWNFDQREPSLAFFAKRTKQIIAGYYDADADQIGRWLDTVNANKIDGVIGVMYTTWKRDYSQLEAFAEVARQRMQHSSSGSNAAPSK
jgi:hypothetical protein